MLLTMGALLAFAANSLLCRVALTRTHIDAASFTAVRILAGALTLLLITRVRGVSTAGAGTWLSAIALFAYATCFSFAYTQLSAGTGALLLFGAVQATMISVGVVRGERLSALQSAGLILAYAGLVGLVLPGLSAPPLAAAALMIAAGVAWGVYSLRGKGAGNATAVTTGNFLRAIPFAMIVSLVGNSRQSLDVHGVMFAIASGALASGVGYAIWYTALGQLRATTAATVQLSVPVLAALGGVLLLHEPLTIRLQLAGVAILGGVATVVLTRRSATQPGA
jgi:drug/metabolite transporter (DMT)-like permease